MIKEKINSLQAIPAQIVDSEPLYNFEQGLFGFPAEKDFILYRHPGSDLFLFLQSMRSPSLSFVLTDGRLFFPHLFGNEEDKKIKDNPHVLMHIITLADDDSQAASINLLGPLKFYPKKNCGEQVVSENPQHQTKHFFSKAIIKKLSESGKNVIRLFEHWG